MPRKLTFSSFAALCVLTVGLALLVGGCNCPRSDSAGGGCGTGSCPVGMPRSEGERAPVDDASRPAPTPVTEVPADRQAGQPILDPGEAPAGALTRDSYARAEDIPNIGRREVTVTGNVVFFEGGMAIGGEAPPSGFALRTDQYRHLYLRHHGQLESQAVRDLENQLVRVTGRVGAVRVGGVETPLRFYPVIDVDRIERIGTREP